MFLVGYSGENPNLRIATPFREAMHQTCVTCHKTESTRLDKPLLADCQTCHETLRSRPALAPTIAGVLNSAPRQP
jgi:cytochrome c2